MEESIDELVKSSEYIFMPQHGIYVAKHRSEEKMNWFGAHYHLARQGTSMLTLREFVDFVSSLQSGTAQDGKGRPISSLVGARICDAIFDGGEWIDAYFPRKLFWQWNRKLSINYGHRIVGGKLVPLHSEPLEPYADKKWADAFSANAQGMPIRYGKEATKTLRFFPPDKGLNRAAKIGHILIAGPGWHYEGPALQYDASPDLRNASIRPVYRPKEGSA